MEPLTPTLTPADRFHGIIDGLFSDITTKVALGCVEWPLNIPLLTLIWRRLRRIRRLFDAILARQQAGTLPHLPARSRSGFASAEAGAGTPAAADGEARGASADAGSEDRRAGAVASLVRRCRFGAEARRFGWVIYAVSWFVNMRHFELKEMLEEPATEALVASAPELGRVLRPLCQMVAVKPPAWLRLPRRPRRRAAKPPVPPPPDCVLNAPGAILRPDGTVWLRLGASNLWRPEYGGTLEQAQKFDPPVRIWPR